MAVKVLSEIPFLQDGDLVLRRLESQDAGALKEMVDNLRVYRYLPTFLFEKKYDDIDYVIKHLYDECFPESLILGVFKSNKFCGLAEFYGYTEKTHKISIGYRSNEQSWGKGIATEVVKLMLRYLYENTDIEIITASTMVENKASAKALQKNGFKLIVSGADEDWGYGEPTKADKWIKRIH